MKRKIFTEKQLMRFMAETDQQDESVQLQMGWMALNAMDQQREKEKQEEEDDRANQIVRQWLAYKFPEIEKIDPAYPCNFENCIFEPIVGIRDYYGCTTHGRVHKCNRNLETCPESRTKDYIICAYTGAEINARMFNGRDEIEDRKHKRRGKGARTTSKIRYLPDSMTNIMTILDDLFSHYGNRKKTIRSVIEKADRESQQMTRNTLINHMLHYDPRGGTPLPVFTDLIAASQFAWRGVDLYSLPRRPVGEEDNFDESTLEVPDYQRVWRDRLARFIHEIWFTLEENGMRKRTECLQEVTLFILYSLASDHQITFRGTRLGRKLEILDYLPPDHILKDLHHSLNNKLYNSTLYKNGKKVFNDHIRNISQKDRLELQKNTEKILNGDGEQDGSRLEDMLRSLREPDHSEVDDQTSKN